MKAANGRYVYKKLRMLYGNSFQVMITHHSSYMLFKDKTKQDDQEELELLALNEKSTGGSQTDEAIAEETNLNTFFTCPEPTDIHYLTDGYLHSEECMSSSEKVQRQIEDLARKVARSIIGARGINE